MARREVVVMEHALDEEAGVYRIVYGERVTEEVPVATLVQRMETVPAPTEEDPDATTEIEQWDTITSTEEVVTYENVQDVVFAADDERWFTKSGDRRAHKSVADDQRELLRQALSAAEPDPPAEQEMKRGKRRVQTMPGQGEVL